MAVKLIASAAQLATVLEPVLRGEVNVVAFDTETTEVIDERFTAFGTDTRIAGFSISFDYAGEAVDLYVPISHRPYDWRRRKDLLAKVDDGAWVRRLVECEGVADDGTWQPGWDPNVALRDALDVLQWAMSHPRVTWGAHNWPFDATMLLADGVEPPWGRMLDTQIESIFTDPRELDAYDAVAGSYVLTGHGLKDLGAYWLRRDASEKDLLDEARRALGAGGGTCDDWSMLPLRTIVAPYAGQDTRLVLELHARFEKRPAYQDPAVNELIAKHTQEIKSAVRMMERGICVARDGALAAATNAESELALLKQKARKIAGFDLPFAQPRELAEAIYERLGLPIYRNNRNTRAATLKQVRQRLMRDPDQRLVSGLTHEQAADLVDLISDIRRVEKELTSFYRPLTYFGKEGVIHTILRPLQAKTTRYSSAKPNMQQNPSKGNVRRLFLPREGHVFVLADYAQQELRVGAHYAQAIPSVFEWRFTWGCTLAKRGDCKGKAPHGPADDEDACKKVKHVGWRNQTSRPPRRMALVEGFLSGDRDFDPHQEMVETCHRRGHAHIDRRLAKAANFALLYGAGPYKLAEALDVTLEFAKELHRIFWEEAYPELGRVRAFIDERLRRAGPKLAFSHQEFIRTLHGARIHLESGYYGLNYLVQRSCREILLNAILALDEYFESDGVPYRLLLPVHDELIIEAPADSLDQDVVRRICRTMVAAGAKSSVPMIVDPSIAEVSWGEKTALPIAWGWNGVTDAADV